MDFISSEVRFALRRLRNSPGFALIAILTLALGIGANTAVFSVINAVLLRAPEGVAAPDRLVALYTSDYSGPPYSSSSYPDYLAMRDALHSVLQDAAAYTPNPYSLSDGGAGTVVMGEEVSGNYFSVLGVRNVAGRGFTEDESRVGGPPAVVLSNALWHGRYASDPAIVGKTVKLNGHPFNVVGVAPPGFNGLVRGLIPALWVPITQAKLLSGDADYDERGNRSLFLIARMKPGANIAQVSSALGGLAAQLHRDYAADFSDRRGNARLLSALPESESRILPMIKGPVVAFMALLMVVVALVLLIGCANLANLLLARASARQREIAIRLAIGASRRRVISQLLVESTLLGVIGGALGLALAAIAVRMIPTINLAYGISVGLAMPLDGRVAAFTAIIAIATTLLFGLAPALQATRADVVAALKNESAAPKRHRISLRNALVIAQVTGSIVLLVGAGLFLRTLFSAQTLDPGFATDHMLVAPMLLKVSGYDEARSHMFYDRLQQEISADARVEAVAYATFTPLGLAQQRTRVAPEGYKTGKDERMEIDFTHVGPGYFDVLKIPMVRGRAFTAQDREGTPRVAVVNEAFAARYWPGQDPIGRHVTRGTKEPMEVIGVARDSKYHTLGEEKRPFMYFPVLQDWDPDLVAIVRTRGDPAALAPALRTAIRSIDPALALPQIQTMERQIGVSLLPQRVAGIVLGSMGALGLALALLGVYGVMSFLVSQRRREIAIRVSLGAARNDILQLVVGRGLRLAAIGVVIGLVLAGVAARLLSSFIYGVSTLDPVTFVVVPMLMILVALLAAVAPARRALRVNPLQALRAE